MRFLSAKSNYDSNIHCRGNEALEEVDLFWDTSSAFRDWTEATADPSKLCTREQCGSTVIVGLRVRLTGQTCTSRWELSPGELTAVPEVHVAGTLNGRTRRGTCRKQSHSFSLLTLQTHSDDQFLPTRGMNAWANPMAFLIIPR